MAPYVPEEVDVFTVPHSRMKELVHNYFAMVQSTNFTDGMDLQQLLECLSRTFIEFKSHEQIENRYIMKRLKIKLKRLSISNTAVCDCHKDDALTDMMKLLQAGYKKKTEQDRLNYGLKLKKALEDFTKTFLPHMKEEEEVFQPLLLQHFSYEEMCELKQKVLQQHFEQELHKTRWLEREDEKCDSSSCSDSEYSKDQKFRSKREWAAYVEFSEKLKEELAKSLPRTTVRDLPPEVVTKILQYLQVQDLSECAQVSQRWNQLAMDPGLWKNVLPSQWARGDWSFHDHSNDDDDEEDQPLLDEEYITLDDDADIDESQDNGYSTIIQQAKNEARILSGLSRTVLPQVGASVQMLVLAKCRTLTNGMLQRFLSLCPNVEHLDLSHTRITDAGLRRLGKNGCGSKLKTINMSGCVNITDATMVRLAMAISNNNQVAAHDEHQTNDDVDVFGRLPCDDDEVVEPTGFDRECLCERYYEMYRKRLTDPCVRSCRVTSVRPCDCMCDEPGPCNVCDDQPRETCNMCAACRSSGRCECRTEREDDTPLEACRSSGRCECRTEREDDTPLEACRSSGRCECRTEREDDTPLEACRSSGRCECCIERKDDTPLEACRSSGRCECRTERKDDTPLEACRSSGRCECRTERKDDTPQSDETDRLLHGTDRPGMNPMLDGGGSRRDDALLWGSSRPPDKPQNVTVDKTCTQKNRDIRDNPADTQGNGTGSGCQDCRREQHKDTHYSDAAHPRDRSKLCKEHKSMFQSRQDEKGMTLQDYDSPEPGGMKGVTRQEYDSPEPGGMKGLTQQEYHSPGPTGGVSCGHTSCDAARKQGHLEALEDYIPQRRARSTTVAYEVVGGSPTRRRRGCCKKRSWREDKSRHLQSLNLSGCYQVTDLGLRALSGSGTFPYLRHLDISGLFHVTAACLHELVSVCPSLHADQLYYCDNILDGPFSDSASGCRNLQCGNRVCCRSGD